MLRVVLLFALMGGAALAKPVDVPAPKQAVQQTEEDAYWNTPEGQDLRRIQALVDAGKVDFETSIREFRQKWYGGKRPMLEPEDIPSEPVFPNIPRR